MSDDWLTPREMLWRAEIARRAVERVDGPTVIGSPPPESHAGQLAVWQSRAVDVVALAGAQGGKTILVTPWVIRELQRCLPLAMMQGGAKALVVGPTLSLMEAQLIPHFRAFACEKLGLGHLKMGGRPSCEVTPSGLRKLWGRTDLPCSVQFGYANDASNLESLTAAVCGWDEVGQRQNRREAYEACNRRLAVARSVVMRKVGEYRYRPEVDGLKLASVEVPEWWEAAYGEEVLRFGRRLFTTTPYQWDWFKSEVVDRADEIGAQVITWPSWVSPVVSREMCEAEKQKMPIWRWSMMYEGKYTKPAGMVYDCFDPAIHVVDDLKGVPAGWPVYLGVDFGEINTAVTFWAHDEAADVYHCFATYHRRTGAALRDHVRHIRSRAVYEVERAWGGAPSEDQWRADFSTAGVQVSRPRVGGFEEGVARTYSAMALGKMRFWRHGAADLIKDIERYARDTNADGEALDKVLDRQTFHLMDAMRYFASSQIPQTSRPYKASYDFDQNRYV